MRVCKMIKNDNKAWECTAEGVDCPECPLFTEVYSEKDLEVAFEEGSD